MKYKWQKGLYLPVGTSQSPPTERQWKVSDIGQQFLMEYLNSKAGVDTSLNNLVSLIVNKQNIEVSGGLNGGETMNDANSKQGIVRVKKLKCDEYDDFQYGMKNSTLSINSFMRDVILKSKCHPAYDKNLEERVLIMKIQNGKAHYTKKRCKVI